MRLTAIFPAFCLCVTWFILQMNLMVPHTLDNNDDTYYCFSNRSHFPDRQPGFDRDPLYDECVLSEVMAGWFWDFGCKKERSLISQGRNPGVCFGDYQVYDYSWPQVVFGTYQVLWVALTFVAIIIYRDDPLPIITGTFCGMAATLGIPNGCYSFPYDGPLLFSFTLGTLAFLRGQFWTLAIVSLFAALMKESGWVLALLLLFSVRPMLLRSITYLMVFGLSFAARQLAVKAYHVTTIILPVDKTTNWHEFASKVWHQILYNSGQLFAFHTNCPIYINGGMLVTMIFLGNGSRFDRALKFIAVLFFCGEMICGCPHETREFLALMPMGWVLYQNWRIKRETV
jgi:hypothetical protein